MNLANLIQHPETLNQQTLEQLQQLVERFPTFQTARLLLVENMQRLQHPETEQEEQKARVYLTDPRALQTESNEPQDRTMQLIDKFLESVDAKPVNHLQPTSDYALQLLQEIDEVANDDDQPMRGQNLIDEFLSHGQEKLNLSIEKSLENNDSEEITDEEYLTETLAQIYIKQGNFSKALEIIKRLNLFFPKKSVYFADQIRFLEKLLINKEN